jgi:hypothetical protein
VEGALLSVDAPREMTDTPVHRAVDPNNVASLELKTNVCEGFAPVSARHAKTQSAANQRLTNTNSSSRRLFVGNSSFLRGKAHKRIPEIGI